MATFLDDISQYNAKAALVISEVALAGDTQKANMMSSLKSTANDTTLSQTVRLNALTALINLGNLLEVALPPYFPIVVEYADTQTYIGVHNDLSGLQGGGPGEYYHLTAAEKTDILNKVSPSQLRFANLNDSPNDNPLLNAELGNKQDALVGTGLVRSTAGVITYDTNVYLTTVSGPAGGDLSGTYPNPTITASVIMGKQMTGWNPAYPSGTGAITAADSLLTAIQKLNSAVNAISPSGVSSVSLTMPSSVFSYTNVPASGAVALGASFISQSANTFFAAPDGTSGTPSFRAMAPDDVPNLGVSPAGTYGGGSPLQIPVITVDAKGRVTSASQVAATGSGTVTSVGIDPPNYFVAGSPVTTSGDITLAWDNNIAANLVLAGPSTGANAAPTFRSLVSDDIPSLAISKITGLSATLSTFLTNNLSDGTIWVGNVSNGAQMRTLTGDVTLSNTGVTTIGPSKVQYSMIQDVTAQTLLGRYELTNGVVQQINLNATDFVLDDITGELSLAVPVAPVVTTKGDLLSFNTVQDRLPSSNVDGDILMVYNTASNGFGLQWNTVNGDVTVTDASTGEITIANSAVTLAKMANLAANSIIGNNTGSSATPIALTGTQVTAMLDQFSSSTGTKGVVPGANGVGATYYLDATGTWSQPAGSGTINSAAQYSIPYYSDSPTGIALSGLAPQTTNGVYFLRANVTASAAVAPSWIGSTGSGSVVLATSPTLVTPNIGAATATSVNGLTITSTTGTLTLVNGSTLATAGAFSTTLTATALTNVTLPTTGTLATLAGVETFDNKTLNSPKIGQGAGQGHFHMHFSNSAPTGLNNYVTVFADTSPNKNVGFMFELDGFESYFQFNAASTSKTYTFPDATGTVALIDSTQLLSVAASGGNSGKISLGGSTSGTITLQAPATVTGTGTYTMPAAYPAAASGYYLTSNTSGVLDWVSVTGGGDVTGPAGPVTDENFAVFDGTTGKIIMEPSNASLSAAGRAVFNDGVDVGISSSTTGTLVFRSSVNAFTTTLRQGTATQNNTYTWPTGTITAGYILSTDASGNLSWSAAGAGDMVLASTQTNTGAKTFNNNTLLLRNSGNTFSTTLSAGATSANYVATFPAATGTLALLSLAQTFSALQTFTGGVTINTTALSVASAATFSSSGTITSTVTGAATTPQIYINGATMNHLRISETGLASPVTGSTISTGTKILLRAATTTSQIPVSIGLDTNSNLWIAGGINATQATNSINFFLPNSTTATNVGKFAATASGAYGLVLDQLSGGLIELNQVSAGSATYIDFRGFPTGTNTPNGAGYTLGTGTRIVFYKPGAGYSTTMGYHNSGGIFLGVPITNRLSLYGDNVESFRVTVSNNTSTVASISLANAAGTLSQVVQARETGYVAFTGTTNKGTSYATGTVTLIQLAERVAAIQASLTTHGLIGA